MQLEGVRPEPPAPDEVIRPSRGNGRPERWPVAEDAEVGELVDDDRFEGFRWSEDQAPGKAEPMLPRCTSPARSLIANSDVSRLDPERRSVACDLDGDRASGLLAEPGFENGRDGATLGGCDTHDEFVDLEAGLPGHRRPSRRPSTVDRLDSKHVQLPPEADPRAVTKPSAGGDFGALLGVFAEMTPEPRLTLGEEGLDLAFGMGPTAAGRRRDGDDDTEPRIDRDSQPAGPSRAAEGIGRKPARHRTRW